MEVSQKVIDLLAEEFTVSAQVDVQAAMRGLNADEWIRRHPDNVLMSRSSLAFGVIGGMTDMLTALLGEEEAQKTIKKAQRQAMGQKKDEAQKMAMEIFGEKLGSELMSLFDDVTDDVTSNTQPAWLSDDRGGI